MFKKVLLILVFVSLFSCQLFQGKNEKRDTDFEVLWRTPVEKEGGNFDSILEGSTLYFVGSGISAINIDSGEILWQNRDNITTYSNLMVTDKYLLVIDGVDEEEKDIGGIAVIDKSNGKKVGYIVPSILFFDYEEKAVQFLEWWIYEHKGFLYMPIDSRDVLVPSGIYRIDLNNIVLKPDEKSFADPELFLEIGEKQRVSSRPIFEEDRAYFYIGGLGPLYVEGEYHLLENCYTQDVVKMVSTDLNGEVIWERGFNYLGCVYGGIKNFQLDNNTLYAADASGLAAVNKESGDLVFEKGREYDSGSLGVDYLEYYDNKMFYSMDSYIKCSDAKTGELLWQFDTLYTNSTNPIVFGDLVYNVDADSLKAFNINSGKLVYENRALGIDGWRTVGYIPFKDDKIYIMGSKEIIAVRLKGK